MYIMPWLPWFPRRHQYHYADACEQHTTRLVLVMLLGFDADNVSILIPLWTAAMSIVMTVSVASHI
jgi:hypothetical protein